jgi:hypothetical protein
MTTFIGDVHGKFDRYKNIIKSVPNTIQVGDMGVGFRRLGGPYDGEFSTNPPYDRMVEGNHRFIRGNHDNPSVCKRHTQYIADGAVEGDMMFIGGAFSIDKAYRTENYNWWAEEELSYVELDELVTKYLDTKPRVMVTHECPDSIADLLCDGFKLDLPSRTRSAFDSMWAGHKPEVWVFGHWHFSFDQVIMGTRFKCLNELETWTL